MSEPRKSPVKPAGKVPALTTAYLYYSGFCNLSCRHCWIEPEYLASGRANSDLPLKEVIAALEECIPLGLSQVKLTGGEPFLRQDILELLDYLVLKKLGITIETNGTLIKENEARAIKRAKVRSVAVSLDSPEEGLHEELRQIKGSFKAAIEGIRCFKEAGVENLQIIMCLWRKNAHQIKEMLSFAEAWGVASLKINPITPTYHRAKEMGENELLLSTREILDTYHQLSNGFKQRKLRLFFDIPSALLSLKDLKENKSSTCRIKNILGILANGNISICGIGKSIDRLILGRVGKDRIRDIWERHAILRQIREEVPAKMQGVCGRCLFKFSCLGKCRANVFCETNSLLSPFSLCQEAYEQGLFPLNRLMK